MLVWMPAQVSSRKLAFAEVQSSPASTRHRVENSAKRYLVIHGTGLAHCLARQ